MSDPLKIFICYAREDRPSLDMLMGHLAVFERNGSVKFWYDEAITGGKDWAAEIRFNLKSADIVLLLISPEFFRSDYIHSVELAEALERDTQKEALVVPVILKKCLWHRHKEIARLQALPEKGNPVWDKNHWSDPDDGFYDVAVRFDLILEDPDTEARRARKQTRLEEIAAAEAEEREMRKRKEEAERQSKEKEEQKRREEALKSFIEMVHIQGGAFQFGDQITVTVSDFMIGKYPVTQKQWREIMGNNPSHFKGDDLPVESVSWEDAQAFIQKLNERFPGHDFRLPSEAEWEYAARGGRLSKGYKYAGSNNLEEVGWFWENSGDKPLSGEWDWDKILKNNGRTHPVGQKKANELELYDMSGNVWEWCEDDWLDAIADIPKDGAPWIDQPKRSFHRVGRGGSWGDLAGYCCVSGRNINTLDDRDNFLGFRLVLSPRR